VTPSPEAICGRAFFDSIGQQRRFGPAWRMSGLPPNVLQNLFWSSNEEQFSVTNSELEILIHRTGHSDSVIAELPWPGGLTGSFATHSPR
jgi:hypothetical protein